MTDASVGIVRRYCEALGRLDVDAMLAEVDDNVVLLMPVAPDGFPKRVEGKMALASMLEPLAAGLWTDIQFLNLDVRAEANPERVIAEFEGNGMFANGTPYRNTYVNLFTVQNGRIVESKEFFDPIALSGGLS